MLKVISKDSKLKVEKYNTVNKLNGHMIKISKKKNDFEAAIFFAGTRFGSCAERP